jgi:hypothetical protein
MRKPESPGGQQSTKPTAANVVIQLDPRLLSAGGAGPRTGSPPNAQSEAVQLGAFTLGGFDVVFLVVSEFAGVAQFDEGLNVFG